MAEAMKTVEEISGRAAGRVLMSQAERALKERNIYVWILDVRSPLEVEHAYAAYEKSHDEWDMGDAKLSIGKFLRLNAMHFTLFDTDGGMNLDCTFGLEFCEATPLFEGEREHWVNWLYFAAGGDARRGMLKRCGQTIVEIAYDLTTKYCRTYDATPLLMLRGRAGWTRVLRSMAIERDAQGWISEDQERFRHGFQ